MSIDFSAASLLKSLSSAASSIKKLILILYATHCVNTPSGMITVLFSPSLLLVSDDVTSSYIIGSSTPPLSIN